jgi:pimeloyl-ACP methyl ester carboxylesterase
MLLKTCCSWKRGMKMRPMILRNSRAVPATVYLLLVLFVLSACAGKPLNPWTADSPPFALVPLADAGIDDRRGRFREIFCEVLESRGKEWPDYRSCEEALTRVADEPEGSGEPVQMGVSHRKLLALIVPGVGWECIETWLKLDDSVKSLMASFGFQTELVKVDGLSGSENNARQIRDFIEALPVQFDDHQILLIGYSKGAPDILQAIVQYPELKERVVAVISAAGAIGGSPLANAADQKDLNIIRRFPGADCSKGDGGAIDSLRPAIRRSWLAHNRLPDGIAYYSLVTYPEPDRISSVLGTTYRKLSQVDARNDSQVLYYDQVIPGSTLLGFINADHWALAVPIARSHSFIGSTFVDKNDYPREALVEALLRFVEEDLERREIEEK